MKYYLKWKWAADAGNFEYYNKETETNEKYNLKSIAITDVCYTIKGWDEDSNSAIYSNNITKFKEEELTVRSGAGELVKGIYSEIKEEVKVKGAKLHIQVTGIQDWEEVVIALKGMNFFQLSETLKNLNKEKDLLVFEWNEDAKNGVVKFKKTIFGVGKDKATKDSFILKDTISSEEKEMEDVFA